MRALRLSHPAAHIGALVTPKSAQLLQGTDLEWYARLSRVTSLELTAAGGITTMEEIHELRKLQVHAALGMAIYTGRLSLEELASTNRRQTS